MARSFKYGIGSQEVSKPNITNTYQRLATSGPRSFKYGIGSQELSQREPGELDLLRMFAPMGPGGGIVDYFGGSPEFRRSKMAEGQRYYPSAYQHLFGEEKEKDPWAAFYQTLGATGDIAMIAGTGTAFLNPLVGGTVFAGGLALKAGSKLLPKILARQKNIPEVLKTSTQSILGTEVKTLEGDTFGLIQVPKPVTQSKTEFKQRYNLFTASPETNKPVNAGFIELRHPKDNPDKILSLVNIEIDDAFKGRGLGSTVIQSLVKQNKGLRIDDIKTSTYIGDKEKRIKKGSLGFWNKQGLEGYNKKTGEGYIPWYEQRSPAYHSKLIEAVENLNLPKATGDQFYKTINKIEGIKKEEKELFKLNFLENNQEKWTKQQVLDHLNKNKVEPEEIILGGKGNQLVWEEINTRPIHTLEGEITPYKVTSEKSSIGTIEERLVGKEKSGKYEIYEQRFDPDIFKNKATQNKIQRHLNFGPEDTPMMNRDRSRLIGEEGQIKNKWFVVKDVHTGKILEVLPDLWILRTLHDAELAAGGHALNTKYLKPTTTETVKHRQLTLDGKGGEKGSYEEILLGTDPDFITKEAKVINEGLKNREKVLRKETMRTNPELLVDPETGTNSYAIFKQNVLMKDPEWQKLNKAREQHYGPLSEHGLEKWVGTTVHGYTHPSLANKPIRVRTGIYKTKDGKPTQFGEEIQNDYGQLVDKYGVINKEPIIKAYNEVQEALKAIEKANAARIETGAAKRAKNLNDAEDRLHEAQYIYAGGNKQPPDMPFSTKSSELGFRRLVQRAVQNDINSVTWTPARTQGRLYKHNVPLKSIKLGRIEDAEWFGRSTGEEYTLRSIEFIDAEGRAIFRGTVDLNSGRIGKYGERDVFNTPRDEIAVEDFQIMVNKKDKKTGKKIRDARGNLQKEPAHIKDILESTNKEVKEDIINLILKDKQNEKRFFKKFASTRVATIEDPRFTIYEFRNPSDDIEFVTLPDKFRNLKKVYDQDILEEAERLVKKYGGEVRRTNIESDTPIMQRGYYGKSIERSNSNVWEMTISPELKKEILEHGIAAFAHGGYIKNYFNIEEGNI